MKYAHGLKLYKNHGISGALRWTNRRNVLLRETNFEKRLFFRKRSMYNAAKAQGSAKFQRGNGDPCVFSERAALAGHSPEAVKRGE